MLVVCAGLGVGLLLYLPFLRASRSEQMTVENLSRAAPAPHNPVQGASPRGAPLGARPPPASLHALLARAASAS